MNNSILRGEAGAISATALCLQYEKLRPTPPPSPRKQEKGGEKKITMLLIKLGQQASDGKYPEAIRTVIRNKMQLEKLTCTFLVEMDQRIEILWAMVPNS